MVEVASAADDRRAWKERAHIQLFTGEMWKIDGVILE